MFKKILSFEILPILALLATCLSIGIFTVKDYGQSWDEISIYDYADYSIQAYQYAFHPEELEPYPGVMNEYGPAYFMLAQRASYLTNRGFPIGSHITAIHFVYFLTSLIGFLVLYLLSKRWMSNWAAFGTTLLFMSQPLIWGHSFINPKDTPFMVFFLTSIYIGLQMMDAPPKLKWVWVLAAGVILGLTISIRVIGPWAGVLVFLYGLLKFPRKLLTTVPLYLLIAALTSYLTWPYLWGSPITSLIESLKVMSNFPITFPILFWGNLHQTAQLPSGYFPILLGLQLTEPALALITIGFVISLVFFFRDNNREYLLLFIAWCLFPVFWIMISHSALYDNARQLLFLWPSLFIFAGLGLDWLLSHIKSPVFKTALLLVSALPGILACVQLHPYEYIYYNSLAGGVKGAYRDLELDYWVTSFKESMEYLNKNAEEGATVMIVGSRPVARQYARPDLVLITPKQLETSEFQNYYILASTRANMDQTYCKDSEILFGVERNGGILSYIKKITPGQSCK